MQILLQPPPEDDPDDDAEVEPEDEKTDAPNRGAPPAEAKLPFVVPLPNNGVVT